MILKLVKRPNACVLILLMLIPVLALLTVADNAAAAACSCPHGGQYYASISTNCGLQRNVCVTWDNNCANDYPAVCGTITCSYVEIMMGQCQSYNPYGSQRYSPQTTSAAVGVSQCKVQAHFDPSYVTAHRSKMAGYLTLVLRNTGSCRIVFDTCQLKIRYASGMTMQGPCSTGGPEGSLSVGPGRTARYSWYGSYSGPPVALGNSYWIVSLSGYACPALRQLCTAQAILQVWILP